MGAFKYIAKVVVKASKGKHKGREIVRRVYTQKGLQDLLKRGAKKIEGKGAKGVVAKGIYDRSGTTQAKAWNKFAKQAKKELGSEWDGKVSGDMVFGSKLSDKAKNLYRKYMGWESPAKSGKKISKSLQKKISEEAKIRERVLDRSDPLRALRKAEKKRFKKTGLPYGRTP